MRTAPAGEKVRLGSEIAEVWPACCQDGYQCWNCSLSGKFLCAPRWRCPQPVDFSGYPLSPPHDTIRYPRPMRLEFISTGTDAPLEDVLPGHPSVPIPDGGYTRDLVERAKVAQVQVTKFPMSRITDESCGKCGYESLILSADGTSARRGKDVYICRRCGHRQTANTIRRSDTVRKAIVKTILESRARLETSEETLETVYREHRLRVSKSLYRKVVSKAAITLVRSCAACGGDIPQNRSISAKFCSRKCFRRQYRQALRRRNSEE